MQGRERIPLSYRGHSDHPIFFVGATERGSFKPGDIGETQGPGEIEFGFTLAVVGPAEGRNETFSFWA